MQHFHFPASSEKGSPELTPKVNETKGGTKGQNTALEPIFGLHLASPIFRVPNGTIASHIITDNPQSPLKQFDGY